MAKKKRKRNGPPKLYPFKQGVSYDDECARAVSVIRTVYDLSVAGAFRLAAISYAKALTDTPEASA